MKSRVLVTGSGNVTGQHVIRALLGQIPVIIGADFQVNNAANQYCYNYVVPKASQSDYINVVRHIIDENNITHIIASNDHDLRTLSSCHDKLGACVNGISGNIERFLNKFETTRLFVKYGVLTPEIIDVTNYPCVVRKTNVGDGKKFVYVMKSCVDYVDLSMYNKSDYVVTRYIEGDEYTIDVLCDNNSTPLSIVPRLRKEVRGGMVHFAEVIKHDEIIQQTRELATKCGLVGINCVQCIWDGKNCWFTEVNARPGSGTELTTQAGVNMPLLWLQLNEGQIIDVPQPNWGLKMVRYSSGYFFK